MRRKILFLILGGVVIAIGLFIFFKKKNNEDALARFKGGKITLEEFQMRISEVPSYYQGFLATRDGKVELLNGMIAEAVLIEKAKKEGLHKREEIKRRLKNVEDRVLLETMVQELQRDRIAVSDEEVKEYFQKNEKKFINPEQVRVSHILVKKKSEAKSILNELRQGGDFEKLARKYSIDSITAPRGGDLGYISRGEMIPEFEDVAFALENKNDISEIIETPFGYHLVKLTGKKQLRNKNQEEIDYEIRATIQNEKLDGLMERYKRELMISINYDLLDEISVEIPSENKGEAENEEEKSENP